METTVLDKTVDKIYQNYGKHYPADFPGVLPPPPPLNVITAITTFQMLSTNIVLGGKGGITHKIRKGVTIRNIIGKNCIFINRLCPRL